MASPLLGAIIDLNGHATYLHWHFIDVSLPNVLVIALALLVFVIALVAPFPGARRHRSGT